MSITPLRYDEHTAPIAFNTRFVDAPGDLLILREGVQVTAEQLRQMQQVLNAAEMHAMVSPRINDGSPLSLPYDLPAASSLSLTKARSLAQTARQYLPAFSRVPAPSPGCVLIKRSVVERMGGLDPGFPTVAAALLAYSCQINQYGFNAAAANHVFVESGTLSPLADAPSALGMDRIHLRYPAFATRLQQYLNGDIHACDRFLELLDPNYHQKPRVLLNYSNMSAGHNGTTELQTSFLRTFQKNYAALYDISVLVSPEADRFHQLSGRYPQVYYPDTVTGKFHIAYMATPPLYPEQYGYLNRNCLKTVFTLLDMITSRCDYLWVPPGQSADMFRLGMKLCDAMIAISDSSVKDYRNFFAGEPAMTGNFGDFHPIHPGFAGAEKDESLPPGPLIKTIYPASGLNLEGGSRKPRDLQDPVLTPPFTDYILLVGNPYPHKALQETLRAVKGMEQHFIVVGAANHGQISPRVFSYRNRHLPEEFLCSLYAHCKAVVFPSLYEGFGLPLVNGLRFHKPVIVHDNGLTRELLSLLTGRRNRMLLYRRFNDIPALIDEALSMAETEEKGQIGEFPGDWEYVASQMEAYLQEILRQPVNPQRLQNRYQLIHLAARQLSRPPIPKTTLPQKMKHRIVTRHPLLRKILRNVKLILSRKDLSLWNL